MQVPPRVLLGVPTRIMTVFNPLKISQQWEHELQHWSTLIQGTLVKKKYSVLVPMQVEGKLHSSQDMWRFSWELLARPWGHYMIGNMQEWDSQHRRSRQYYWKEMVPQDIYFSVVCRGTGGRGQLVDPRKSTDTGRTAYFSHKTDGQSWTLDIKIHHLNL